MTNLQNAMPPTSVPAEAPVLSICIPTYNRAELLRAALYNIVQQTAPLGNKVEVIVSDNCSSDHTPEVMAWIKQFGNVRYHRNSENIGFGRNSLQLTQVLAEGEYCWIFGDDDLLHDGAVQEILSALSLHADIDYAFVNSSYEQASSRTQELDKATSGYTSSLCSCNEKTQQIVDRWEHIIRLGNDAGLFTFIGNHILRTSLWRQKKFEFKSDIGFPSLEATFPHACAVASSMIGKPALYIGKPYVIAFLGAQEWFDSWPMIQLIRVLELAEYMAKRGAETAMINRYRDLVLRHSSQHFWKFLTDKNIPGRQYFNASHLCRKYWKISGFYKMLSVYPFQKYIRQPSRKVYHASKRIYRGNHKSIS